MPRREPLRRGPSEGRRRQSRTPGERILLVCGAEKTEVSYFKGLRGLLSSTAVNIRVLERPKAPDSVVTFARDHCDRNDFDQTWCVLDVDQFEREGRKISEAFLLADAAGISLAVSNPCFEFWLLLHHIDSASPFDRCSEVADRLNRYVAAYDKTKLRFADFGEGIEVATKRAKQRDPTGRTHVVNPSSGVWALVEKLMEHKQ